MKYQTQNLMDLGYLDLDLGPETFPNARARENVPRRKSENLEARRAREIWKYGDEHHELGLHWPVDAQLSKLLAAPPAVPGHNRALDACGMPPSWDWNCIHW